jgi:pSer/pThr/pTyr-binding forkhead associated (FHA) protein
MRPPLFLAAIRRNWFSSHDDHRSTARNDGMLQVTLKVVGGELESAEIPLQLPAIIGRGRDVAINLSHPLVSRRHCELLESHGQLRVRDLGSLNGTFVGSQRVVEATVRPGDLLTVGTVTFRALYQPAGIGDVAARAESAAAGETVRTPAETVRVDVLPTRPADAPAAAPQESTQ